MSPLGSDIIYAQALSTAAPTYTIELTLRVGLFRVLPDSALAGRGSHPLDDLQDFRTPLVPSLLTSLTWLHLGQGHEQRMVSPQAIVGQPHPLLAFSFRRYQRAVTVDSLDEAGLYRYLVGGPDTAMRLCARALGELVVRMFLGSRLGG
jgi:hypothetical protein